MNPVLMEEISLENRRHYYNSSRLRAYCCGCVYSKSNTTYVCFFWAVISFYFAVLAFLQKSPFYSYVDTVPLVVFGAINLLFGIVTLTCMVFYTSLIHRLRMAGANGILTMNNSRGTVFAITANAIAVLIVTLVNFILFVMNKRDFDAWCISTSVGYVEFEYSLANNNTAIPENRLSSTQDIYNCDRLFYDEVKWSLLCLIIMCIVYIHWILIVAARKAYNFYYQSEGPLMSEFSNIAPKSKRSKTLNVLRNVKPSKSIMKELLTHRQYGEFLPSEETLHQEKLNIAVNDKHLGSNIIQFEDDLYNSKEIKPPCNAFYNNKASDTNCSSYSVSDNASTVINFGA